MEASEGAVQPGGGEQAAEGQGAQSQELDPGLFPGIENVPSEYRQHIDPILRQMDTNANKRISEVNEKLEAWKPYEELGVRDNIDPETMEDLIGFVEMLGSAKEDPTQLQKWWNTLGQEFQFFEPEGEGEEEGDFLDEGEGQEGNIEEIVTRVIEEQMRPFQQVMQNNEVQEQMGKVNERIDEEFNEIKQKVGEFSDDPEKNAEIEARIIRLAIPYANQGNGEGSILKGFDEYQAILKDGEGSLFKEVSEQPEKPEGPGTPDTTKQLPTDFKETEKIAQERLAQLNQQ